MKLLIQTDQFQGYFELPMIFRESFFALMLTIAQPLVFKNGGNTGLKTSFVKERVQKAKIGVV